jgi:hypothetical protein
MGNVTDHLRLFASSAELAIQLAQQTLRECIGAHAQIVRSVAVASEDLALQTQQATRNAIAAHIRSLELMVDAWNGQLAEIAQIARTAEPFLTYQRCLTPRERRKGASKRSPVLRMHGGVTL